jgi:peptidoglycan biosynthesis protein MviN/MurJ (putative lipid II flippase)
MRRHLHFLETRALLVLLGKLAVAGTVLAAICLAGSHFLLADWPTQPFWPKLAGLTLTIAVATAGFLACAMALKVPELSEIAAALRRRFRGSSRPG